MNRRPRKKNKQMMAALVIGAILNVIILLVLGGITVYKFVAPQEVELQAPPPLEAIDPPIVKYNQQKTKDRQESSKRPRQQQIKAKSLNNIVTPDIDIQVANVNPGVSVGEGVGDGLGSGGGLGAGSLRMGKSAVDFFGIKSSGERIVIILDIAPSMLALQRGDIPGFERVKQRLVEVVEGLNSATLFNLMVYSHNLDVMSNDLVLANAENKKRAANFIEPYWKANGGRIAPDAKRSTHLRNYKPEYTEIVPAGGNSRMDMALLASFEQGADAIFMITDGTPHLIREFNETEQRKYDRELADYERRLSKVTDKEREKYEKELAQFQNKRQNKIDAENRRRDAEGLDDRIGGGGKKFITPPWGRKPRGNVLVRGEKEFVEWVDTKAEQQYGRGRDKLPSLNIIGYSIEERGDTAKFLNSLRRGFPGGKFEVFGDYRPQDEA
ncbi:MAG: hypothetical protein ACPGN3_18275 [Opitutales bacterium]